MLPFIVPTGEIKPNRITDKKDKEYHLKFARYCASSFNNWRQQNFITRAYLNKNFYRSNQWIAEEDTELFLKDIEGNSRQRIKVVNNIIRPMVEQYRGNAIRMSINASAKAISKMAINRREKALAEVMFQQESAEIAGFEEEAKKKLPIGDTPEDTRQIFENTWVDKFVQVMNWLMQAVAETNEFQQQQVRVAESLAFSGLSVMFTEEFGGNQKFELVESDEFFFDNSAKRPDLKDAEFMGRVKWMVPTEIFERFQIEDRGVQEAIEQYSRNFSEKFANAYQQSGGRIPVINAYWRDTQKHEYGYVMDRFGYPIFTRINYTYEGEEAPRYTDKDLIELKTVRAKKVLKGKKKAKLFCDEIRYCFFIPREIVGTSGSNVNQYAATDFVLEYGLDPYQETNSINISEVEFPFKCSTWSYVDGEILSPLDDVINPQRMINRFLSVAENQMNNATGANFFYDKSALDNDGSSESDLMLSVSQSKPFGFNAKGRGMQNIMVPYDGTIRNGTMVLFNIIDTIKNYGKEITGVNDPMSGAPTGEDQLVGVTELLLERGSLIQEPFYNAVASLYLQCYKSIGTKGKRIYIDNERELAINTGDEGVVIFKISKDMALENFRIFIKRENDRDMLIRFGNQLLDTMYDRQLIDKVTYANLFNRSTPEEVSAGLRQYTRKEIEVNKMVQQQNQAEEQQIMDMAQAEQAQAEEKANANIDKNNKTQLMFMEKQKRDKIDEIYAQGMVDSMNKPKEKTSK